MEGGWFCSFVPTFPHDSPRAVAITEVAYECFCYFYRDRGCPVEQPSTIAMNDVLLNQSVMLDYRIGCWTHGPTLEVPDSKVLLL